MNELRVAGIATIAAANVYLADHFVPQHNARFARPPREPASAFVALGSADIDTILCHEETRVVARDNTITIDKRTLQIAPQPGRRSCTGRTVTVRHHLDGRITLSQGARVFGTFAAASEPMDAAAPVEARETHRAPTRRLDRRPKAPAPHKRPQASP